MLGLITDRTQNNVDRRNFLAKKGWHNMTAEEQAEWSGNPLLADGGVNLIPRGENYAVGTSVKFHGSSTLVTSLWDGSYIYAILVIGPAADYENKTMTFSLDSCYSANGAPQAALYWHDANGYEFAGASLTEEGSVTFTASENTGSRANLALYLYATTDAAITAGEVTRYDGLMLELGDTRHAYVPHYGILPTEATKGAYNYSDLNRVENAVAELADLVGITVETKTDWTAWDIPARADMQRYLNNIAVIRGKLYTTPDCPETPGSMEKLTYTAANNIEKILADLDAVISFYFRCGEIYCGEV